MLSRLAILAALGPGLACSKATSPAPPVAGTSAPVPAVDAGSSVVESSWRASAADYLDQRVGRWLADPPSVANVKCAMSCHTTFPAVLAHASLPADRTTNIALARTRFEARLPSASRSPTPFYGRDNNAKVQESHATEAVLAATAFVLDDLARGDEIGAAAQEALERMWARQAPDGAWMWLDFGLEPWEHQDAFGVAMAALAVGRLPDDTSPGQTEGVNKIRSFVSANLEDLPLHDKTALLWSSSALDDLLSPSQAKTIAAKLRSTQRRDGSFAIGRLMPDHAGTSLKGDGYATALAALALCTTGLEPKAAAGAIAWLHSHQQADGSWPGRSLNGPGRTAERYMTDASTGYAVLALSACAGG